MTKVQEPLFNTKLECPICKTANEFEIVKQGAYTESGRDTDFMPTGRMWTNPAYQKYDPLLYFAATCKFCFYTRELNAEFKEWQNDTNFKSYKLPGQAKKHLEESKSPGSVITMLGGKLDPKHHPFESAVIKLLLTVYDEKLLEHPSPLDLARFFLRMAWLYRDNADQVGNTKSAEMMLNVIQMEINRLKKDVDGFEIHIPPLNRAISKDLSLVVDANKTVGISSKLIPAINNIQKVWDDLKYNSELLQQEFSKVAMEINLLKPDLTGDGKFWEYAGFREFLYAVKEKWNEVPVNETEALSFALNYYLKAYQSSREIKAGLQQLQAAYLIAELSRRVNDLPQAREYFKTANKMAQELMAKNRNDKTVFSNAQKIFEMSLEQGRVVKNAAMVSA